MDRSETSTARDRGDRRPARGCAAYLASFEGAHSWQARRRSRSPRASTWACARPWRPTTRSCSWARTSASSVASSASPTDCRRTSARTGGSLDSPLAESGIVGTAVGHGAARLPPRRGDPVRRLRLPRLRPDRACQVAKYTYRSQGKVKTCPIVILTSRSAAASGAPAPLRRTPEAQFAHTPGLKVVACSNPASTGTGMIQQAIAHDDPVIFLEPKRQYHADKAELDRLRDTRSRSSSRGSVRPGDRRHPCLAYGPTVKTALKSAEAAATEGRQLEVIDLRTLSPLDMGAGLRESVRRTGALRDHPRGPPSTSA